jgi:iron complex outermembrane receptor protein
MKIQLLYSVQWLLLLSILIQPDIALGQIPCNIILKGKVLNAETQEPIAFASIAVKDQNIGTLADENGNYVLDNLCEGTYTIVCSHVSCDHHEHVMIVENDMEKDFELEEHSLLLEEIVVREKILELKTTGASNELSAEEMGAGRGLSLADALEQLPGVTSLKTGASIAKPVIQGLHSNRVLLLNNGVRQEAQQWGSEHAPAIDPFLSNQLKVVKGANSVRYGAGAIGGVILMEPAPLPEQAGIGGELNLQGLSNGRTGIASGMLAAKLNGRLPISGRIQGTLKRGGNLHTPDYFLDNTGLREINYSWALGLKQDRWETELFYSRFSSRIGIFGGAHIGNLTDLLNAIEREEPLKTGDFSYELGRPQQRISMSCSNGEQW